MNKYIAFLLIFAAFVAASYQDWTKAKEQNGLSLYDIKQAFEKEGIPLKPVPEVTYFKLYGKEPSMLEADGSDLALYSYNSAESTKKALEDFEVQTADVKAVLAEIYKIKNVLIFEARELPAPSEKVQKAVEALKK